MELLNGKSEISAHLFKDCKPRHLGLREKTNFCEILSLIFGKKDGGNLGEILLTVGDDRLRVGF